jgi:aromatic-L-amino-acid decarboxylase
MFTPIDCSALFTSRPGDLRAAFSLIPEYLRTSDEDVINLMDYGPALGRRFRALKLWAVLRVFGREGLQHTIREHVRMACEFERWVEQSDDWELVAPRPFSVVCFRRVGSDELNERLLERVNESGRVYMSHTRLDGRYVLRLAIGNADTHDGDVRLAWDELNVFAEELERES